MKRSFVRREESRRIPKVSVFCVSLPLIKFVSVVLGFGLSRSFTGYYYSWIINGASCPNWRVPLTATKFVYLHQPTLIL